MIIARFDQQYINKARDEIDKCGFNVEQGEYVWKWMRRKVNFVEKGVYSINERGGEKIRETHH